jgi:hypothetical protein
LKVADGLGVLELGDLGGELFDFLFERAELVVGGHRGLSGKKRVDLGGGAFGRSPLEL